MFEVRRPPAPILEIHAGMNENVNWLHVEPIADGKVRVSIYTNPEHLKRNGSDEYANQPPRTVTMTGDMFEKLCGAGLELAKQQRGRAGQ